MNKKQWASLFISILLIFSFSPLKAEVTNPNIVADSAILIDANTKTVLYEKNGYSQHYPASITKLMTALLTIENLSPNDTITFSQEAIFGIEPGSSHIGINVDEQLTVDQALHGLLLMSANEVANGLAEAVSGSVAAFAERMNERAKALGALNTHFVNPHGLHDVDHYTTAYDMALIASYLAENEYFLQIMKDSTYQIPGTNKTDEIRYLYQQHKMLNPSRDTTIYREDVIGGKTGYTDEARQTLVTMAKQGDTTLIAVVLKSERDSIYTDTAQLLDYGFESYHSLTLHTADDILKTLPVYAVKSGQTYQTANCGLGLSEDVSAIVLNTVNRDDITLSFNLPDELDSNAKIGDVIGEVSFMLNSKLLSKHPLIIKQLDSLPESNLSFYSTQSSLHLFKLVIVLFVIVIIIIILLKIRQRNIRKRYSKINRLFK